VSLGVIAVIWLMLVGGSISGATGRSAAARRWRHGG
jgi:hypothetical protein